jgi:hypothetical protein
MEIFRKKITINILLIVIFSSFFLVIFNISLDFKSISRIMQSFKLSREFKKVIQVFGTT